MGHSPGMIIPALITALASRRVTPAAGVSHTARRAFRSRCQASRSSLGPAAAPALRLTESDTICNHITTDSHQRFNALSNLAKRGHLLRTPRSCSEAGRSGTQVRRSSLRR